MSIRSNVKLNVQDHFPINHDHSDIESYLYATDDADRYADYLADKSILEAELQFKHIAAFTV